MNCSTKKIFWMVNFMDMEHNFLMVENIKENLNMVKEMVMEFLLMIMDINIKEIGKIIKDKEKDNI